VSLETITKETIRRHGMGKIVTIDLSIEELREVKKATKYVR